MKYFHTHTTRTGHILVMIHRWTTPNWLPPKFFYGSGHLGATKNIRVAQEKQKFPVVLCCCAVVKYRFT